MGNKTNDKKAETETKKVESKKPAGKRVKAPNRTDKERRAILKEFNKARKGGVTAVKAAESVKVPYITIRSWIKKFDTSAKTAKPKRGRPSKAGKKAPKSRKPRQPKTAKVTMKVGNVEVTTDASTAAEILKKLQ